MMQSPYVGVKDRPTQTKQDSGTIGRWEVYVYVKLFQKSYSVVIKDLLNATVQGSKQETEQLHLFYESTFQKSLTQIWMGTYKLGSVSMESRLVGAWDSPRIPWWRITTAAIPSSMLKRKRRWPVVATWIHPCTAISRRTEPWLQLTLSALPVPGLHVNAKDVQTSNIMIKFSTLGSRKWEALLL